MDSLILNQNKMTAVSSLVERLLPLIDRSKISDVALHSIVEGHLSMEKEQRQEIYQKGFDDGSGEACEFIYNNL